MSAGSFGQACRLFLLLPILAACAGTGDEVSLRYPNIDPKALKEELQQCEAVDRRLRQVDALRWSMREDGVELETDFEQMVQVSLATAAAIAIAVPLVSVGVYDPIPYLLPYGMAYGAPDLLKRTDALLVAVLAKREELQCAPHSECIIEKGDEDTLTRLRSIREQVESGEMPEKDGIEHVTALLDDLCPVGDSNLHRLSTDASDTEPAPGSS